MHHNLHPLRLLVAAATLPVLVAALPCGAESEVILLRHADKDPERSSFNLSPDGFARAIGLARLIPACLGRPSAITTFEFSPDTSKNARSYQTAVPLAVATAAPIRIAADSRTHSRVIGEQFRTHLKPDGERLVLFWEHRRMPELAQGLGWDGMKPIADDDFDQIFRFRYSGPGSKPEVTVLSQRELGGQACFREARFPLADRWTSPFSKPSP